MKTNKVLWTKMNLYQDDGKAKMWKKKGSAHDPKFASLSLKHEEGCVMATSGTHNFY